MPVASAQTSAIGLPALLGAVVLAALVLASPCPASDQPQRAAMALPSADDLIPGDEGTDVRSQLSSGTFDQRQSAMWELWRDRDASRDAVLRGVRDPDPEVSSRARWILDRWRRGILPDTPPDLARQLETVSQADSLSRLLDLGLFSSARIAIEEAAQAEDQQTLTRAAALIGRAFPFHIRSADAQGQLEEFAELLDRLATTADMVICRNQVWELLGRQPPAEPEQPVVRKRNGEATDPQRIAVTALAAADRLDEATQRAREADDPELLRVCQLLRRDWTDLARTQQTALQQLEAGSGDADRHWAYLLIAAARGGDDDLRRQAIAALSRRPSDASPGESEDPFFRLRWQVLAMHGEIDAAVGILQPTEPLVAAELLAQAGRLGEAMAVIDFDPEDADSQITPLIATSRAALARATPTRIGDVPEELERLIAIARLLFLSGRRDAAWDLFAGVAHGPADADGTNLAVSRVVILHSLMRLNRTDWLPRMILQDEAALSGTGRHFLSRALDVQPETIDALARGLGQLRPRGGTALAQDVIDFLSGEVPQDFDPQQDYQRLYDVLAMQPSLPSREDRLGYHPEPLKLSLEIAKLFESHGQIELAKRVLVHLATRGETEAILEYADAQLKDGQAQSARSLFEAVWRRVDQQRQDPSRLNRAEDDALLAMRAILGEAIAAGRLGDSEGSDQLWTLVRLMACTPSAKLRESFASHLLDEEFDREAESIYRVLVPWVAFGSDEGVEFYSVARNFNRCVEETQPALAADVLDLSIAGTIESTVFYPAAYVSLPAYVHRKKAAAAIPAGDAAEFRRQADAVTRLNAIDIDFGEKVVKQLREAGMEELADEVIQRIYDAGAQHLQQFPLDIVTANNLAWILALSDHRLDDALVLSRRAVYFAPDSTVYRDTLAEVLFRLGRVEDAIAIAEACLLDNPGEWHVHEQLRRFEAAQAK